MRLLPAVMLGAALIAGSYCGLARCEEPPAGLEKEIVVTAPRPQDAALAAKVLEVLQHNPFIFAEHVSVTAENGIVRVSGVVQDLSDMHLILRLARRMAGKRRVVNELEYAPSDDDSD